MPWISKIKPGDKFGKWTIVERHHQKRPHRYLCECECGLTQLNYASNLTSGKSTQCNSCGGFSRASHDLIGNKFNYLQVISIEKINGKSQAKIKCDCGNEKYVAPGKVKNGTFKSCGLCDLNKKTVGYKKLNKYKTLLEEGNKKGCLTIIKKIDSKSSLAKCDCGKEIIIKIHHMQTQMPSCGCYWKEKKIQNAKKNIGLKWGYLKVIKFLGMLGKENKTRAHYLLKCKCGNEISRSIGQMFDIKSCGCLIKENGVKGEKNPMSKLKDIEVKAIRELFESGLYTRNQIAVMMDIKYNHACIILKKNKHWKHLS